MLQYYLWIFHLARLPFGGYSSNLDACMTELKRFGAKRKVASNPRKCLLLASVQKLLFYFEGRT
jgi:hypothetical protein